MRAFCTNMSTSSSRSRAYRTVLGPKYPSRHLKTRVLLRVPPVCELIIPRHSRAIRVQNLSGAVAHSGTSR